MKSLKLITLLSLLCCLPNYQLLYAETNLSKTCSNLTQALNINTSAYKACLYQKAGEKYSQEELSKCKSYYLQEIERLSYVYKNLCK